MRENVGRWAVCGVRLPFSLGSLALVPFSQAMDHFFLGFLAPKTSISVARV